MPPEKTMSVPRGRRAAGALAGLLPAAVALGVAQLVSAFIDSKSSPVVAVGGSVIDATPQWLKQLAIRQFGTNDKLVLIGSIVVVLVMLALLTGALAVRRATVGLLGVAVLAAVGAVAALTRPVAAPLAFLPSVVGGLAGAVALLALLRPLHALWSSTPALPVAATTDASLSGRVRAALAGMDRKGNGFDRRAFLATSLGAAAVAGVAGGVGRVAISKRYDVAASRAAVTLPKPVSAARAVPTDVELGIDGLSLFRTPNKDFYRVDTALIVPQLSTQQWRLKVHGMVDHEIELTFDELLGRGLIERDITLTCVSNEIGGPYVGTARWLGAPLADLLTQAGVHKGADQIVSTSVDGMTIGTPTAVIMDGRDAMLAVGMNGQPLPAAHGFPVRMVVPGLYGYVSATKWVIDIEATTFAKSKPYWVKRSWALKAPIKTMSRIDTPRPLSRLKAGAVAVAGVAWAQHRGIERVEVRVDAGPWNNARLAGAPSTDTWLQWVWMWDARPGQHTLEVRATDKNGDVQTDKRANPFPSGASGWHSTVVSVA
ncbi:MAG: molybdopterin-dependent oxidoreductase [Actinomycetes bacterium]